MEIAEELTVAECEYCGTKQTVPTSKDEGLQGLFNRANTLRLKSEFDRAESLYEKIIQNDETQAEAYWGLILCKYGIEYVEDPATFKRIPTCHRASFDSIIADEDYKSALKYADMVQKSIYESEATEIDRIQKKILALSQKEEPYDVFICYKETDDAGKRTQDSVIANDIYHQLIQEGFKVFYAAITLENKLGSAYEPCIFAALNSAKVMLAIGTKPEYFNAVWVKNEWSRFLKIIKKDSSKLLIPCYRDMDAYELPDEFAHLQAQDMSKIGFINDLVRGIKKVNEPSHDHDNTYMVNKNADVAPLIKRIFMFLEDKDWKSADDYCEKVLDLEPENASAYLGKFLADLNLSSAEELSNISMLKNKTNNKASVLSRVENINYKKICKYGNEKLISMINGYINSATSILTEQGDALKDIRDFENARINYLLALESDITFVKAHWGLLLTENKCVTNEELIKIMIEKNENITSYINDWKNKGYLSKNYIEYENVNNQIKNYFELQCEELEKQISEIEFRIDSINIALDELNANLTDLEKREQEQRERKSTELTAMETAEKEYEKLRIAKSELLRRKENLSVFAIKEKRDIELGINNIHKLMQECTNNKSNIKREIESKFKELDDASQKETADIKYKIGDTQQKLGIEKLQIKKLAKQKQEFLGLTK